MPSAWRNFSLFRGASAGSKGAEGAPGGVEARDNSLENPAISLADPQAYNAIFGEQKSSAGVIITPDKALGIPAVWCAVNFIAGTIASLPLILYQRSESGRERATGNPLYGLLHDVVNEDKLTSFWWRKQAMTSTMLYGRSFTFIERNRAGRVMNLWPLDTRQVTVARRAGRKVYIYRENTSTFTYTADEIIDIPYLLGPDGISTIDPISRLRDSLGLALALESYGAKIFQNGGVPPLALQGPMGSPAANARAAKDIDNSVKRANDEQRNVLTMPLGYELKPIGFKPIDAELVDARRFQIEEVARIFDIPPVFLQDLTNGTFSNTEQQDLHFVKHTLTQWLSNWEGELNAKLIADGNTKHFAEFNVDGLLRGDFKSRMTGYSIGIQNAVLSPDEARQMENRPKMPGGDQLFIQGATVPITDQEALSGANAPPPNVKKLKQPATNPGPDPATDLTGADDD